MQLTPLNNLKTVDINVMDAVRLILESHTMPKLNHAQAEEYIHDIKGALHNSDDPAVREAACALLKIDLRLLLPERLPGVEKVIDYITTDDPNARAPRAQYMLHFLEETKHIGAMLHIEYSLYGIKEQLHRIARGADNSNIAALQAQSLELGEQMPQIMERVLLRQMDNYKIREQGLELVKAAHNNDWPTVEKLLRNVNYYDAIVIAGNYILPLAARKHQWDIVYRLLQYREVFENVGKEVFMMIAHIKDTAGNDDVLLKLYRVMLFNHDLAQTVFPLVLTSAAKINNWGLIFFALNFDEGYHFVFNSGELAKFISEHAAEAGQETLCFLYRERAGLQGIEHAFWVAMESNQYDVVRDLLQHVSAIRVFLNNNALPMHLQSLHINLVRMAQTQQWDIVTKLMEIPAVLGYVISVDDGALLSLAYRNNITAITTAMRTDIQFLIDTFVEAYNAAINPALDRATLNKFTNLLDEALTYATPASLTQQRNAVERMLEVLNASQDKQALLTLHTARNVKDMHTKITELFDITFNNIPPILQAGRGSPNLT